MTVQLKALNPNNPQFLEKKIIPCGGKFRMGEIWRGEKIAIFGKDLSPKHKKRVLTAKYDLEKKN